MNHIIKYILVVLCILQGCKYNRYSIDYQTIDSGELRFYPEFYSEKPDLPSPALDTSGREVVLVSLQDSLYTWFDATVENGDTFDYKRNLLGKGNQLLARPLFHLWNISNIHARYNESKPAEERTDLKALVYNGHEIAVQVTGSRGWQESIFNDEILGTGHMEVWRELDLHEMEFLKKQYQHLSPEQFETMREGITHLHTGEMVLFYINRYGFYEGHSDFRADPVTIAYIFGIRALEELHKATGGDLFRYFTTHFTYNPE